MNAVVMDSVACVLTVYIVELINSRPIVVGEIASLDGDAFAATSSLGNIKVSNVI